MAAGPPERDTTLWRVDLAHFEGLEVAALATDAAGRVVYCNASAQSLFGYAGRGLQGQRLVDLIVPPGEQGGAQEILAQVMTGRGWSGEFPLLCPGDEVRQVQLTCTPLRTDHQVVGVLWVVQGGVAGPAAATEHQRAERLAHLARVNAELVTARSTEAVTNIVISHAADAVGATVASLSLRVDDDTLSLVGMRGGLQGAPERWATYPVDKRTPAGEAVLTGEPVVLAGRDAIREAYPELESAADGERSLVCLPLRVTDQSVGVITLSFPGRSRLDGAELEFLGILADTCAQAIDRIQAVAAARERRARLRFLADASSELAATLDYQSTLRKVADLAVPVHADWCAIALVEDGELRTHSVAHTDPTKVSTALDLQERYPAPRDAPQGSWHVYRTGESELLETITDEMLVAATRDEEHLRLARELDLGSALLVPLRARGEILGVMTWVFDSAGGRRYSPADIPFAEDVARRVAVAIDNAQLHSEVLDAAIRLQRAVLPDKLTVPAGWEVAYHYSPAGRTDVGGDFYDVLTLEENRLAVFVGDVMGRGVTAAAAMAQVSAAVRAYAAVDASPEVVMRKLDLMFATYDISQLVTMVYLVVDRERDVIELTSAGHLPPLLRRENGTIEQLAHPGGAPLGAGDGERVAVTVPFRTGDTLLAFTDGLVERRTEDIDRGQARLAGQARLLANAHLQSAVDELVETVRDHTRSDDIAAVAVRRT